MTLLRQSAIGFALHSVLLNQKRQFYLYEDTAYVTRPSLQGANERTKAIAGERIYERGMSSVQEAVE